MQGETSQTNGQPAGFFDVDGTLSSTNIVLTYLAFRLEGASTLSRWAQVGLMVPRVPYYKLLDRLDRDRFCQVFYRRYAHVRQSDLEGWVEREGKGFWNARLFPEALQKLEEHKAQGHRIVLVSGGLEPLVRPLADDLGADALIATEPEVNGDHFTGRVIDGSLNGEKKAQGMRELSEVLGVDLDQSYAYGDSYADREFLETVGNPAAVNPDRRLRKLAERRGWPIYDWGHG